MGIGAQKCGTTWLYRALSKLPEIAFPGGKEVHYWDQPGERSLNWYSQLFSDASHFNGDITPAYGFLPVETIQKIYAAFPDLPLIYMIRNPIERAWSSARMALGRAEMQHDEASDQWFIDHFKSRGSLARGDYETCIRQWRSVYPSDRLLIVRYENIATDPVGMANACLRHLGMPDLFASHDRDQLRERVFEGDGVTLRPTLLPSLSALYAHKIESLAEYLGEDFSNWNVS